MKNSKFGTSVHYSFRNFFKNGVFSMKIVINGRIVSFYREHDSGKLKFKIYENAWRRTNTPIPPPFDFNPKK